MTKCSSFNDLWNVLRQFLPKYAQIHALLSCKVKMDQPCHFSLNMANRHTADQKGVICCRTGHRVIKAVFSMVMNYSIDRWRHSPLFTDHGGEKGKFAQWVFVYFSLIFYILHWPVAKHDQVDPLSSLSMTRGDKSILEDHSKVRRRDESKNRFTIAQNDRPEKVDLVPRNALSGPSGTENERRST